MQSNERNQEWFKNMCSPSLVTVNFLEGLDNFSVNGHLKRWASFGPSPKPSSIFVLVISAYIRVVREFQLLLLWLQRCVVCDDIWIYWRWEVLWQEITFHNTKCLSSYWLLQSSPEAEEGRPINFSNCFPQRDTMPLPGILVKKKNVDLVTYCGWNPAKA